MKKYALVCAVLSLASANAFAKTYSCDVLKNSHGQALLGGPSYAVDVTLEDVVLQVTTGADEGGPLKTVEFKMEKIEQQVEGAVYEAQGVDAILNAMPLAGKVNTTVSISQKIGKQTLTADCQ